MSKGRTLARPWGDWKITDTVVNTLTQEPTILPDDVVCWTNDLYTVLLRTMEGGPADAPPLLWLSIRRNDRKPARDWRHLQRIKNELVGPECEGMEMFPAESRLVDESNQTHLWVMGSDTFRWPWGYTERSVLSHDDESIAEVGAVQRPFEEE